MLCRFLLTCLFVAACAGCSPHREAGGAGAATNILVRQIGVGSRFASRDPYSCTSRKEPASGDISAAMARQYFICDNEFTERSTMDMSKQELHLVTGVTVEVGAPRPFELLQDATPRNNDAGIDPHFPVYPIRGGFTNWSCEETSTYGYSAGHNCDQMPMPKATGICFKSSFGEWHCNMTDLSGQMLQRQPAPMGD